MFGGVVEGSKERGYLARDGGDVDDVEEGVVGWSVGGVRRRVRGGGGGGGRAASGEEVSDCELGCADGMGDVDLEAGVVGGGWAVAGLWGAGRVPE